MAKKTLLLGGSMNPNRYAFLAIHQLLAKGYVVRAIGKRQGSVNSVKIHNSKKKFKNIDTVSIYLNKNNQREYYDYIINLNPNRVVFNPGSENKELEKLLDQYNINFERSCMLVKLRLDTY